MVTSILDIQQQKRGMTSLLVKKQFVTLSFLKTVQKLHFIIIRNSYYNTVMFTVVLCNRSNGLCMLFDVFNSLIVDIELLSYKIYRSVSLTPQSVVYKNKCKVQELVSPLWVVFLHLPHCAVLSIFFLVKKPVEIKKLFLLL